MSFDGSTSSPLHKKMRRGRQEHRYALNEGHAVTVFHAVSRGIGNERIAGEILNTLTPMPPRDEAACEKSQGKWSQDEYVETVGVRLAAVCIPARAHSGFGQHIGAQGADRMQLSSPVKDNL